MSKKKKPIEYKTISHKCGCCISCKVYTEGPMQGKCPCGGPFKGYYDEKGNWYTVKNDQNETG